MKSLKLKSLLAVAFVALTSLVLVHCGDDAPSTPVTNPGATTSDLGNLNLNCPGQTGSQQKQIPFQQQIQSGCKPQQIQFQQQKIHDYDVNFDCASRSVTVLNKGKDSKQQSLPIQNDGTVKGKIQYQQQVQNDGKGNASCWIQYEVNFSGKADCETTTPDKLALTTEIAFAQSSGDALRQIGVEGPIVVPSGVPSNSPSPTPSLTPSPSPSPSASASPQPSPTPSGTPIVVCLVDDPCPITGATELTCGQ